MGAKGSNSAPAVSSKRTGSSKRRRTCSGGLAKTSPPAGFESTSFAWAHAGPAMANDKQVRRSSTTDRFLISTLPSEPAVADGFDHTPFIMLSGEVRLFTNLLEEVFCEIRLCRVLGSSRLTLEGAIMLVVQRDAPPKEQRGNPCPTGTRGG